MPPFRIFCGGLCLLLALIFLVANTAILGRYGYKSGLDQFEAIIHMLVAGSVPMALALMPFFLAATWRPGYWVEKPRLFRRGTRQKWVRGRPNPMVVVGFLLYGVFIAFNFMGAIGSIAHQKSQVVDDREGHKSDATRWKEARKRKVEELDQLVRTRNTRFKQNRPSSAIQAEIDGAKVHAFWSQTSGCEAGKATQKQHARYCGSVAGWKQELSLAEQIERLQQDVDDLDRKLASPEARIASADPQGEVIAGYLNFLSKDAAWKPEHVRYAQPLVWFALLELSCMFLFAMALRFFRVSHVELRDESPRREPMPISLPAPVLIAEPSAISGTLGTASPELQAAVYQRFWSDCTRRMEGAKESVTSLYAAYRAYCARPDNAVAPFAFPEFVARAGELPTSTVAGTTFVVGVVIAEPMGSV